MKIGKPDIKTPLSTSVTTQTQVSADSTTTTTPSSASAIPTQADPSAKIQLSNTASTLLSGDSTPEFDAAKVASISNQINQGSYRIHPEVIADKLIANAQELLSRYQ